MSIQTERVQSTVAKLQAGILLIALLAFIMAGYAGFRAYAAAPGVAGLELYVLAVVAGVASFFSPCAFPLLPSYFAFYHQAREGSSGSSTRLGLAAGLGVMTFDLLLGLAIAILGTGLTSTLSISGTEPNMLVQYFRGLVGLLLLTLGFGQLLGWNLRPRLAEAFSYRIRPEREGKRSPVINMYLYGFGYIAVGIGCTGPIMAGLIVLAISAGGFGSAMTAFLIFSLTMGALMLIVSTLVAASREGLIRGMKAAGPKIKQASALLLIFVGLFNMYTSINLKLFLDLFFP